jgi:hypothetical protein
VQQDFFSADLETFKSQVARFLRHVDAGESGPRLDAAWKTVCLFYLNLQGEEFHRLIAASYLRFASRRYAELA